MSKASLLIGFVVAKLLLQYVLISPEYELHRDEFLHLDQARHLAWGFISVPPLTSCISFIILSLGNSFFWIRFFPALFGALTLVVVWKAIEELKGNTFALVLGATGVLFSALLRLNGLYQPNSPDVLCWTSFCYVLVKYSNSEHPKWLYTGAVVLAFGFLNKYNIVFLLIGVSPALVLTNRSVFKNKHFYISILLFLVLILPNLIWQYNNHFPVYNHMRILTKTQLVNVNRVDFLKEQLLFFIGSLFVILSGLYGLLFYPPFKRYRFFFWTFCFTLVVFTVLRAKGYYAMGLYPIYIAFGATYLETLLQYGRMKYLQPVAILIPVLFFIPMYNIMFPNKSPQYILRHSKIYKEAGLLRWEDGKDHAIPQDYADMLGWKEMAHKTDSIYATLTARGNTLILCDNYGEAGAINYYTQNKNLAAVSFSADYINWFHLEKKYVNLIRIKTRENAATELKETSPFFEKSSVGGTIRNRFSREFGTAIFVFENTKVDVNERLQNEIDEEKQFR